MTDTGDSGSIASLNSLQISSNAKILSFVSHSNALLHSASQSSQYLILDANTRRNLELTETARGGSRKGSLLAVLDETKTNMGARNLRRWLEQPLRNVEKIRKRLDAVEELVSDTRIFRQFASALVRQDFRGRNRNEHVFHRAEIVKLRLHDLEFSRRNIQPRQGVLRSDDAFRLGRLNTTTRRKF